MRFSTYKELAKTSVGRRNIIKEPDPVPEKKTGKAHTNARKTVVDHIKFDSQLEADYYLHLKMLIAAKEVLYFHRQVIFDLGGGTVAKIDFQIFFADGRVEYHDPKGRVMREWKRNKKQIEGLYGIKVLEVFKGDF